MKNKNNKKFKPNEKLNFYSGAPVNQGFYKRNLNKAKKLYMDEYDRLKQQIYKRRQDREFNEILSNYYNDFSKLSKKHPFLQNYDGFNKSKEPKTFDFNQYELKKKNINALFFKYDNYENDFNFEITDELINSMNDGNTKSFLNSFEIKEDYKKRLALHKKNEIKSDNDNDNNNINLYSTEKNINLSIISEKKQNQKEENIININSKNNLNNILNEKEKENEDNIINENYQNKNEDINSKQTKEKLENKKEEKILNVIKKEQEDELTRYNNYLKENKYPVFGDFINPYKKTDYIPPPTFIQNESQSEKKESESNKVSEYNDFEDIEGNKKENESSLKKSIDKKNENENAQLPIVENMVDMNSNMEYQNPQFNNPNNLENNKKEESREDEYENDKFEEIIDNTNNNDKNQEKNNDNLIENNEPEIINQYQNGELKMVEDIIKDDKFPQFEQIINPYYQTNYNPPDIFIQQDDKDLVNPLENGNKETNSNIESPKLALTNELGEGNKNSFPKLQEDIIKNSSNNQMLDDIIQSNNNYNIPNNSEKEEEKNELRKNEEENRNFLNKYGINNGNEFIPVEQMINQNFQQNNIEPEEIKEEKEGDNEYDDFEPSNM